MPLLFQPIISSLGIRLVFYYYVPLLCVLVMRSPVRGLLVLAGSAALLLSSLN